MLKEMFGGRNPSHFQMSPMVRMYIISESFMWSAWNFTLPIFAIFVTQEISNGNVQVAAIGYSTYLISRVAFELLSGRWLQQTNDRKKIQAVILGMLCLGFSYLGFAFARTIPVLFFFYFISGAGIGIAAPGKNALFSIHLDKNKEATEWSISDAFQFFSMALATALGGFIAFQYGFQPLFILAFIVNFLAILPYILYLR